MLVYSCIYVYRINIKFGLGFICESVCSSFAHNIIVSYIYMVYSIVINVS